MYQTKVVYTEFLPWNVSQVSLSLNVRVDRSVILANVQAILHVYEGKLLDRFSN